MLAVNFPAKVLLFGEYTILNGSRGMAFPYNALSGSWSFENTDSESREESRKSLLSFIEKSNIESLKRDEITKDFDKGIWFNSDIPQGFGLGSSGALIAALFSRYGKFDSDFESIKSHLARLEDFFHGSSSGLDPLISHIQKTLLIHNFNNVEILEKKPDLAGFFLLNTGRPRSTGPLVSIYQEKLKDPCFKESCADVLSKDVNFAIEAFLAKDEEKLFHHLWHISKCQWDYFQEMIPETERELWSQGLKSRDYLLKLCGAGGGGFLLVYSNKYNISELRELIPGRELRELK